MHEKYSHKILTTTEFIQIQIFLFFFFWRNRISNRTTIQQNISNPTYFRIHLLILFRARERSIPPLKNFKRDQISIRFKFFSESNFELTVRESNKFPFQDSDFSSKIRKSGTSDLRSSRQTDYLESSWPRIVLQKVQIRTIRTFTLRPIADRQISFREQREDIDASLIYPRYSYFSLFFFSLSVFSSDFYLVFIYLWILGIDDFHGKSVFRYLT